MLEKKQKKGDITCSAVSTCVYRLFSDELDQWTVFPTPAAYITHNANKPEAVYVIACSFL